MGAQIAFHVRSWTKQERKIMLQEAKWSCEDIVDAIQMRHILAVAIVVIRLLPGLRCFYKVFRCVEDINFYRTKLQPQKLDQWKLEFWKLGF